MRATIRIATLAIAVVVLGLSTTTGAHAQGVTLGVDATASGNSATGLGSIQDCRTVEPGDNFDVDVFVTGMDALTGFEFYLQFDPDVLQVTGVDDSLMLAAASGSSVASFTETPPGPTPGSLMVATADLGEMGTTDESGNGVLARFTFKALSAGTSTLSINEPKLATTVGTDPAVPVEPAEGQIFIGPVFSANVAVNQSCTPPPSPTPHPSLAAVQTPQPGVTPGPGTPGAEQETPGTQPAVTPGPGTPGVEQETPGAGRETPGAEEGTPGQGDLAQPTSTEADQGDGGLSTGAWIGIGIGIAVLAVATASGGWYLLRRRRGAA